MAGRQHRDLKKRTWWESWLWVTIACSGFALSALQPSVVVTGEQAPPPASVVGPVELAAHRASPLERLSESGRLPVRVGAADHFDVERELAASSFFELFERLLAELLARLQPGGTPPASTTTTVPPTTTTTRPVTTTTVRSPTTTTTVGSTTTTTRPTTTTTSRPASTTTTLVDPTTTTTVSPPTTSTTAVGPTTTTVVAPTTTSTTNLGSTTTTTTTGSSTTIPSTTIPSTTIPSTTIPSTTIPPTTVPPTTTTQVGSPTAVAERRFVELINEERQEAGLSPLEVDVEIGAVARSWTAQMISDAESCRLADLNHNPDYAEEMPDGWISVAENVGCGPTVDSLHQALMNSPSHRDNILDPNFTDIGVGVGFDADGTLWVTQNFGQY